MNIIINVSVIYCKILIFANEIPICIPKSGINGSTNANDNGMSLLPTVLIEIDIESLIFCPVHTMLGVVIENSEMINTIITKAAIINIKLRIKVAILFFVIENQMLVTKETAIP